MSHVKFEVGKKYTLPFDDKGLFHTYIGECRNGPVFESPFGLVYNRNHNLEDYSEYKEPKVHIRYVHWTRGKTDKKLHCFASDLSELSDYVLSSYELIKTDIVSYTETET